MIIHVYGPGCAKCNQSADTAREFVAKHGLDAEVVKVSDMDAIVAAGVLRTPATFIDGEKLVGGRVLREKDLEAWLAAREE
jgi:small redox-active disulfide protein 2